MTINEIIYHELVNGDLRAKSWQKFIAIIEKLADQGAEGIILGCTEIPLLVRPGDVKLPLFDTTQLHAEAALDFALAHSV